MRRDIVIGVVFIIISLSNAFGEDKRSESVCVESRLVSINPLTFLVGGVNLQYQQAVNLHSSLLIGGILWTPNSIIGSIMDLKFPSYRVTLGYNYFPQKTAPRGVYLGGHLHWNSFLKEEGIFFREEITKTDQSISLIVVGG